MDVLSEILQHVRLAGALLFQAEFRGPWQVVSDSERNLLHEAMPSATRMIAFHVVLEGRVFAALEGGVQIHADAGDVLVVPHGDVHRFGDTQQSPEVGDEALMAGVPIRELRCLQWGEGDLSTRILCGFLGCERDAFGPLFSVLPRLFKVRLGADAGLDSLLAYAVRLTTSSDAGADGMRLKMAELMFVEAVRSYMDSMPDTERGWLAGLRDPLVSRALALLHAAPERRWTVEDLAHATATSRSALAERFNRVLGEPPIAYLARWRMLLASRQLRDSHGSIATIAEAVGYESPAAFQRGFLRHMGATPGQWRRQHAPAR